MKKLLKPGHLLRCCRNYKIIEYFESGGFSELYIGKKIDTNRKVVIKILQNSKFTNFNEMKQYLIREKAFINIQSRYSPHTLRLIDSFIDEYNPKNPKFIIITNYMKGMDLDSWFHLFLIDKPKNPFRFLIKNIFYPLSDYLDFLHSHGVMHRDFSPGNILIIKSKGVIIPVMIDYGASLNFDPGDIYLEPPLLKDIPHASVEQIYTPGYSSPEIYLKRKLIPQSDICSFGLVLHYILSGGHSFDQSFEKQKERTLSDILMHDYPLELKEIVLKCIQYEPRDRFLTFNEINRKLKEFLKKKVNIHLTGK